MSKELAHFRNSITIQPDGCWLWKKRIRPDGYGEVRNGDAVICAHRYSYAIHKGLIPNKKVVMHTCDVRACVNPDHLVLGTQSDNMMDALRKKRNK